MRFGPYNISALKELTDGLEKLEIPFSAEEDKSLLQQSEENWKSRGSTFGKRGSTFDPAFIYLDIADELLETRTAELLELGLLTDHEEPDFSKEEFVCPACGKVVAEEPGTCRVHSLQLIPWSEHVARKSQHQTTAVEGMSRKRFFMLLVALLGLAVAFMKFFRVMHRY